MILTYWLYIIGGIIVLIFLAGIRIIRPTHRGVTEWLGKYQSAKEPGFHWVVPIFQRLYTVNTTEQMTNIEPQEMITKDSLNCSVGCVIYFKIKKDPKEIYKVFYEVQDVYSQLDTLARTTARNVIGTMIFKEVNSDRNKLNSALQTILIKETKDWGVDVVRVELKDITPPAIVQDSMNKIISSENERDASINFANAVEIQSDGKRRAAIKEAEGDKTARILVAEGQAKAFDLINKSFTKNAITLKQLEVTQASLEKNSKIIVTDKGITPQLIIGKLETE